MTQAQRIAILESENIALKARMAVIEMRESLTLPVLADGVAGQPANVECFLRIVKPINIPQPTDGGADGGTA